MLQDRHPSPTRSRPSPDGVVDVVAGLPSTVPAQPPPLPDVPRLLGRVDGPQPGPMLVVIGGLHGNEPAGVQALRAVLPRLAERAERMTGSLVGLAGNRAALARGRRYVREDLNRVWLAPRLAAARASTVGLTDEDLEMAELDAALREVVPGARGRVVFLDLHSTSGGGAAFSVLDDTLANRALARVLPAPCVLGLEEELAGTLLGHLNREGYAAVGFECGQHADVGTRARAEAAVWIVLEGCGVLPEGAFPEVAAARALLGEQTGHLPSVVEVRDKHHIPDGARFVMRPGYGNFDPLVAGEPLAEEDGRTVVATMDGLILMPLYQAQGQDGFFVVRRVREFWLWLSRVLRRLRVDRIMHWLPGVQREGERHVVDRRRARWLALELFHLLGFRRLARDEHTLVMERRVDAPEEGGSYGP